MKPSEVMTFDTLMSAWIQIRNERLARLNHMADRVSMEIHNLANSPARRAERLKWFDLLPKSWESIEYLPQKQCFKITFEPHPDGTPTINVYRVDYKGETLTAYSLTGVWNRKVLANKRRFDGLPFSWPKGSDERGRMVGQDWEIINDPSLGSTMFKPRRGRSFRIPPMFYSTRLHRAWPVGEILTHQDYDPNGPDFDFKDAEEAVLFAVSEEHNGINKNARFLETFRTGRQLWHWCTDLDILTNDDAMSRSGPAMEAERDRIVSLADQVFDFAVENRGSGWSAVGYYIKPYSQLCDVVRWDPRSQSSTSARVYTTRVAPGLVPVVSLIKQRTSDSGLIYHAAFQFVMPINIREAVVGKELSHAVMMPYMSFDCNAGPGLPHPDYEWVDSLQRQFRKGEGTLEQMQQTLALIDKHYLLEGLPV